MMFGRNMQMTDEQVEILSKRILEKYYYLKLSDIYLFISRMESSEIYGQLSPHIILMKLEKYFNERCGIAALISQNESETYKSKPESEILPDALITKIKHSLKSVKPINRKDEAKLNKEAQLKYIKDKSFGLKN